MLFICILRVSYCTAVCYICSVYAFLFFFVDTCVSCWIAPCASLPFVLHPSFLLNKNKSEGRAVR